MTLTVTAKKSILIVVGCDGPNATRRAPFLAVRDPPDLVAGTVTVADSQERCFFVFPLANEEEE